MPRTSELEHDTEPAHSPDETPPEPQRPASRRKLLRFGLIAFLVIGAGALYFWWSGYGRESTDDAQVDGHIAPISPKVSGSVLDVLVDINFNVHAGQLLVRLDPRDYQAKVDQLKAAVTMAESQAHAAEAGVPLTRQTTTSGTSGAVAQVAAAQAEYERAQVAARQAATSGIAAAQAGVAEAEANNRKGQADLARMQPLAAKEEVSRQQFDSYTAAAQVAAAQLKTAQEQLTAARQSAENARAAAAAAQARVQQARASLQESRANQQQVTVSAAQAQSASAAIQQARANLAAAELDLGYTNLFAPISGVITNKNVEKGQFVQAGQALMSVVPLNDVWVTANFKETQLAKMRVGQRAEVKVDAYHRNVAGHVDSFSGATGARTSLLPPENSTGNFVKVVQRVPVKIVFDQLPSDVVLRPGMNVDATVFTR